MRSETPLFPACPIGCTGELETSSITLSEGALRICPRCGQMLSACSKQWFDDSMQEFDQPEGTLPSGKNALRYQRRMGKILSAAAAGLGKQPDEIGMLDVGCSSGALLRVAGDLGFAVCGIEPATAAASTARALGFDIFDGLLEEAAYADNHFDLVTLFEVIEHLTEPADLLLEIRRILKPGGILLVGTGNGASWTAQALSAKWEYFDISLHGGHISFFNPESLRRLAKRCDFDVASIQTSKVNFAERKDVGPVTYRFSRLARELMLWPSHWLGKGHDMLATLQKP